MILTIVNQATQEEVCRGKPPLAIPHPTRVKGRVGSLDKVGQTIEHDGVTYEAKLWTAPAAPEQSLEQYKTREARKERSRIETDIMTAFKEGTDLADVWSRIQAAKLARENEAQRIEALTRIP